jgi:peptidoglycan/LPS O-acetylase OafA/YrhL
VVAGAISIEHRRGLPTIKPLKLLGDGSNSIYLFHTFVFYAVLYAAQSSVAEWPVPVPVGAMSVTIAGTSVRIAALYLFERPLTALMRRLTTRVIVAAVPAVSVADCPTTDIAGGAATKELPPAVCAQLNGISSSLRSSQ